MVEVPVKAAAGVIADQRRDLRGHPRGDGVGEGLAVDDLGFGIGMGLLSWAIRLPVAAAANLG